MTHIFCHLCFTFWKLWILSSIIQWSSNTFRFLKINPKKDNNILNSLIFLMFCCYFAFSLLCWHFPIFLLYSYYTDKHSSCRYIFLNNRRKTNITTTCSILLMLMLLCLCLAGVLFYSSLSFCSPFHTF